MRIDAYKIPKSSFLSVEKDFSIIIDRIMKNERLKKLIYYSVPDALDQPNVPQEEALKMLGTQIRLIPKIYIDKPEFCYVVITQDGFVENFRNPEFRDNVISFIILCHFDQWNLTNFKLRPYVIAGELDSMFNNEKLTGIGELKFLNANLINENDEFGGFKISYTTIHAYNGEDSKYPLNPNEETDIKLNYDQIFNGLNNEL